MSHWLFLIRKKVKTKKIKMKKKKRLVILEWKEVLGLLQQLGAASAAKA